MSQGARASRDVSRSWRATDQKASDSDSYSAESGEPGRSAASEDSQQARQRDGKR